MQPGQAQFDQGMVVEVEIGSLSVAASPRSSGADLDHIRALAEVRAPLPPIVVHRLTMRVIDGVHRLRAAELRGDEKIAIVYFDGSDSDAFVLAVESNITHGLPLSMADRKSAAARIIVSHPQWSDRMIASVSGLSPGTVGEIRRRAAGSAVAHGSRIGQDGRVRPVNNAVGRELAGKIIRENPGLSLRQIARVAGISPETARDVRNRIRRGEEPLPQPCRKPRPRRARQPDDAGLALGGGAATGEARTAAARVSAVNRLKADPALRFSESGRTLLRMLNVHVLTGAEWQEIIDNVPPHCRTAVAGLARECSGIWRDIAARIDHHEVQQAVQKD
ncbi:ParB N-terminal domain-containing protein [Streptomyces sp. NPDC060223]|uniref:ParB/RepB/Spo0J family partition protein n=1 Tax=unclassified Streptomyces TaxID=2593676 RepID=UPI003626E128